MKDEPSTPAASATAPEPTPDGGSGGSSWTIFAIALLVVFAIVGFVLFGLGESSLLPVNYQGFDGKAAK